MSDYIDVWFPYEEPKVFARELTMRDWEPGGVVYEGLHGSESEIHQKFTRPYHSLFLTYVNHL